MIVLSLAGAAHSADVTPVESVINLLEKLEKQTMDEGKAEAAGYDKFACFCKEQADEKLDLLTAQIKKLTGDITGFGKEISSLNTQIDDMKTNCENEQKARDKQFNA